MSSSRRRKPRRDGRRAHTASTRSDSGLRRRGRRRSEVGVEPRREPQGRHTDRRSGCRRRCRGNRRDRPARRTGPARRAAEALGVRVAGAVPQGRGAQRREVKVVCGGRAVRMHGARLDCLGDERCTHRHRATLRGNGERRGGGEGSHQHRVTPTGLHGVNYTPVAARRPRPSSWAFSATTTVDTDISTAPRAGESRIPARASTPAASGIATAL